MLRREAHQEYEREKQREKEQEEQQKLKAQREQAEKEKQATARRRWYGWGGEKYREKNSPDYHYDDMESEGSKGGSSVWTTSSAKVQEQLDKDDQNYSSDRDYSKDSQGDADTRRRIQYKWYVPFLVHTENKKLKGKWIKLVPEKETRQMKLKSPRKKQAPKAERQNNTPQTQLHNSKKIRKRHSPK